MDYNHNFNSYNNQNNNTPNNNIPNNNIPNYGPTNYNAPGYTPPPYNPQNYTSQDNNSGDCPPQEPNPPIQQPPMQNYTYIPRETPDLFEPLPKKEKKKKSTSHLNIGAALILVVVCAVASCGAAFAGTFLANKALGNSEDGASGGTPVVNNGGTPSVVFEAYENENKEPGTYKQVADAVAPTVVEITTESIVTDSFFWGGNYVTSGAGSGVIISADGLIITNNHVVSGANTITVRTTDGTDYTAKVLGTDSESDIAVIKIEGTNLPFALLGDSDTLDVGEEVVAVGNPLGNLGGTITNGIISALSREVEIDGTTMTLIQTNAEVNPGNSGGGLFNMYGELVGIVNAKSTTSSSGVSVEGIGFAIPINTAKKVSDELVNYGYVRGRVMIGIGIVDVTNTYDAMYYRVNSLGVYITSSEFTDELKSGDRIVAINGEEVTYSSDIKAALVGCEVGDEITIKVVRDGRYIDVEVTLHEYVPSSNETDTDDSTDFENNFGKNN
ncbi:MAG: trypsin-like peptidase domain-containing protein [Clostridia bacterium]|nr:trypsin-like peptidase domain-containing protein [Clostridia bacterium]